LFLRFAKLLLLLLKVVVRAAQEGCHRFKPAVEILPIFPVPDVDMHDEPISHQVKLVAKPFDEHAVMADTLMDLIKAVINVIKAVIDVIEPAVLTVKSLFNPTKPLVNPTKLLINLTKVLINPTKPLINLIKPLINVTKALVNPTKPLIQILDEFLIHNASGRYVKDRMVIPPCQ
jgi:hypothetical protein